MSEGHFFNPNWTVKNIKDVLYAAAIYLRDFKRLSDNKFINVGNDDSNDSCPRACLLKPRNWISE